jgi:hypothetical protein
MESSFLGIKLQAPEFELLPTQNTLVKNALSAYAQT